MDLTDDDLSSFDDKIVLDVGVGSGASSRLWGPRAKEFHGVDIGDGIYRAKSTLKDTVKNPILSHADLHHLPYADESFDIIVSGSILPADSDNDSVGSIEAPFKDLYVQSSSYA